MRLSGKRALVTAAGQGIGRATAELFATEGANVLATDINSDALTSIAGCSYAVLDVRDFDAVYSLIANKEPFDIIFNCAGCVPGGSLLDNEEAEWRSAFDLNVYSMMRVIKACLPGMIARGGGSIINMSSVASSIKGVSNRSLYGTTKAAVIGLTKSVAVDFVDKGIRCNAICPGTVDTPSLRDRLKQTGDFERAYAEFTARQPMGRLGRANEIASAALYLASDESAFVTGTTITIDGGWTA